MNKNLLIGAGVVIGLVLALPLLAALKNNVGFQSAPERSSGGGGGSANALDDAPRAGSAPSPAPVATGPARDASTLPGTGWKISGFNVELQPGGTAVAKGTPLGDISGTWSVSGSTVTVTASHPVIGTRTTNAQISGNQILVDGKPVERVR